MSNGFKKKSSFRCRRTTRKRTSFACETRRRTANHVGSGRSGPNAPPHPRTGAAAPASAPPSSAPPSSAPRGRRDPDARLRLSGVGQRGHLPQTAGLGRFLSTPHVTAEVEGAAGLGWLPRLSLGHRHRHQDSHRDKPRQPARPKLPARPFQNDLQRESAGRLRVYGRGSRRASCLLRPPPPRSRCL